MIQTHLIGPSGQGKTSFINLLANYFFRDHFKNEILAVIPTKFIKNTFGNFISNEYEVDNLDVPKTMECIPYKFNEFTFIDSVPIDNSKNLEKIVESYINCKEINCSLVVLNGTTARLTSENQDCLNKILESFPNSMSDNIVFLFTNCWKEQSNFKIDERMIKLVKPNSSNVFYIKNPFFSCDLSNISAQAKKRMDYDWEDCMETISNLLEYISKMPSVSTQDFKIISESKSNIFNNLENFLKILNNIDQINIKIMKEKTSKDFDHHDKKQKQVKNLRDKKEAISTVDLNVLAQEKTYYLNILEGFWKDIENKCSNLSNINSDLNIVNHLHGVIKSIEFESKKMAHPNTREIAEIFIGATNNLISKIENEKLIKSNSLSSTISYLSNQTKEYIQPKTQKGRNNSNDPSLSNISSSDPIVRKKTYIESFVPPVHQETYSKSIETKLDSQDTLDCERISHENILYPNHDQPIHRNCDRQPSNSDKYIDTSNNIYDSRYHMNPSSSISSESTLDNFRDSLQTLRVKILSLDVRNSREKSKLKKILEEFRNEINDFLSTIIQEFDKH